MPAPEAMTIRPAGLDDTATLHALTGRSVLHWGYEPEFLDWEPEAIAVTPARAARAVAYVLEESDQIIGYYALVGEPHALSLDKLFIEPQWIGTGCGKRLWQHAVATARAMGAAEFTLWSDPNAAAFYAAMGAIWEREEPTTREGWNLQRFRYPLLSLTGSD